MKEKKFWNFKDGLAQDITIKESIIIGGNLNGHLEKNDGYKRLQGGCDFGQTNELRKATLDFIMPFDLTKAMVYLLCDHFIMTLSSTN